MKKLLLLILLALLAVPTDAQEYPKVILPGDYPDPTIMREGEDYYMTRSPFFYAPGFLIWHSKDLVKLATDLSRLPRIRRFGKNDSWQRRCFWGGKALCFRRAHIKKY